MNRRAARSTAAGADRSSPAPSIPPLRRLGGDLLVDAGAQLCPRHPVDGHEAQRHDQRGERGDGQRQLAPRRRRRSHRRAQAVADVAHRLDRAASVVAELAAQVADVDVEHLGARVELEAPHRVEELLARQHLVGMPQQMGEQLELARREVDVAAVVGHAAGEQVGADPARLEDGRGALPRPSQVGAHAREHLREGERLRDVVVRAPVEALDTLRDRPAGRQHDHRQVVHARADRVEHLEAVLAGQEQVEQHQRVVPGQRLELRLLAVVDDGDLVALGAQRLLEEPRERPLVLDDKDPHPGNAMAPPPPPGKSILNRPLRRCAPRSTAAR